MELLCSVMNYDWGKLGCSSIVGTFAEKNIPNFVIDEKLPYAEFWMGTHPRGQSFLKVDQISLKDYVTKNPSSLGNSLSHGADLPFLFKILSIRKALSVQVHPNKEDAKKLHMSNPNLYPDSNHKPELAVALTDFEALCGFRPLPDIAEFMKNIPELRDLINLDHCNNFIKQPSIELLKSCFSSFITSSPADTKEAARKLIERFSESDLKLKTSQLAGLFIELNNQFPGDIGTFSIYFFNHLTLKPGEAIFLNAGLPHAYFKGDCVEVMACSDNVIRAGLTPKERDITTLLNVLVYQPTTAENIKFGSTSSNKYISRYIPPVNDFALSRICVPENEAYTLPALKLASILIVVNGSADSESLKIEPGVVLFIPSEFNLTFKVIKTIEMYQAYANL